MEEPVPVLTRFEETLSRCFYGIIPTLSLYCASLLFNACREVRRRKQREERRQTPKGKVVSVNVRVGEHINAISFSFKDGTTVCYGLAEGEFAPSFDLEENESIEKVLVRSSFFVDSVKFVTNTGRTSVSYVGSARNYFGAESQLALPGDDCDLAIAGLKVETSVQGWLKSIYAVLPRGKVDVTPTAAKQHVLEGGVVKPFREKHLRNRRHLLLVTLHCCGVFFCAASPVVKECVFDPAVGLEEDAVKVLLSVCGSGVITGLCIYILVNASHLDAVAKLLIPYVDRKNKLASVEENVCALVDRIDAQVLDEQFCTLLDWQYRVFITPHWLIKAGPSSLELVSVDDARILESRVYTELYCGEQIDIITLLVQSRSTSKQFTIQLLQSQYEKFEKSFVDVVQRYREQEAKHAEEEFESVFNKLLLDKCHSGAVYKGEKWHPDHCFGECGLPPTVRIVKSCTTCEERCECKCEPMWCHKCLLKWWFVNNRTKTEMGPIKQHWQTRCPNCRIYFCLDDLVVRQDIQTYM